MQSRLYNGVEGGALQRSLNCGPDGFLAENRILTLDGDQQYVTIDAQPLSGQSEFTLSGWVASVGAGRTALWGQNNVAEFGFNGEGEITLWTPNGGSAGPAIVDSDEEIWTHVAAVATGEEIILYVDGEEAALGGSPLPEVDDDFAYGNSTDPFRIAGGGVFDGSGNQFDGLIDEVAVWDVALTGDQIRAQFNAALGIVEAGCVPLNDLLGDLDGDARVEFADFLILSANFGLEVEEYEDGDIDCNGAVEFADFLALSANFGESVGAEAAAVPEPAGWSLIVAATLGLLLRRHRIHS